MSTIKNEKGILDYFPRYIPESFLQYDIPEIIRSAEQVSLRADRERRIVEITAHFPRLIDKAALYAIEEGIAKEYKLTAVRILPKYSAELFSEKYISQIIFETKRTGIVSNGFFNDFTAELKGETLVLRIPFISAGIELLNLAETNAVMSNIIRSEFGILVQVQIEQRDDYAEKIEQYNKMRAEEFASLQQAANNARLEQASRAAAKQQSDVNENEKAKEPQLNLRRVESLFEEEVVLENNGDGIVVIGKMKFDISEPEFVEGEPFDLNTPTPIRKLHGSMRGIVIMGEVFNVEVKELRRGGNFSVSIGITDHDASAFIRVIAPEETANEVAGTFSAGKTFAFWGNTKIDKFDGELYFTYAHAAKIKRVRRMDNYPGDMKRIELHMHTLMSSMDATVKPETVVETAKKWGHRAIAITDHGNVQAYPLAMLSSEKIDMKVIYGIEAYFVDDTARAIYGGEGLTFDDEYAVFDIETTGLSPLNNKITEIGAVIIKNGKVTARYNAFVNPETKIPQNIVELTGITDEMVADAPTIDVVLPEFFEFIGDRMLVAHNAGFDISFIRKAAEVCELKFANPYLDTVAMSRYVNSELPRHTLDRLAEYFGLGDFNHHRASDDAEMLALIFVKMMNKLKEAGIFNIDELVQAMSSSADPLKLKTYHQVILVKNAVGLKNLYKIISASYLTYYRRFPRVPKTLLTEMREGLIIGSACEAGELYTAILENKPDTEIEKIAEFYDYLEIQPLSNNRFMVSEGKLPDDEALRNINRKIYALGKKIGKPVVATCDAHFLDPEDEIYRKILLAGKKFQDADKDSQLYLRTTEEMLEEFSYLGEEEAYEVVIKNPNLICDMIEDDIRPIPKGTYPPHIDGAEEELTEMCWGRARDWYGDDLPELVSDRLSKELGSIIKNGFAVLYIIAQKLIANSEKAGYLVGSRGSVGSSFVATMAGITNVNPLPPHYRCKKCRYSDFNHGLPVGSGFDLPDKNCPVCGEPMHHDGHDIPFETFLGFYGDKSPDIDLNFSGDVQGDAHKFTEVLFGSENAFRAGTIGTLAAKTAYGFTLKYMEERGVSVSKAEMERIVNGCIGIKRTTGQHPGGIIVVPQDKEVYDFTPVQHPADDPNSDTITTHFAFTYLHDTILKLDILGHDIPTKYKRLEEYTGIDVRTVPMNDPKVLDLFTSTKSLGVTPDQIFSETGTYGLPEMGSNFVRGVLVDAQPKTFADLLQISGLTHGTDVWLGNAKDLIKDKICTISEVIGTRDDIMLYLIQKHDLEKSVAFKIMEDVRKGKGLKPEYEATMREHGVPDWYIDSCKKIKYMFPKAHAAAYVTDAIRLGWYKVYHPVEFYAAYFTAAPDGFDSEIVIQGKGKVLETIKELKEKGSGSTQKEAELLDTLLMVNEYFCRGLQFLPVDIFKSAAKAFLPENGKIRLPFTSLPGLGETAAEKIVAARDTGTMYTIEDLQNLTSISKSVMEIFERNNVLRDMAKTNQLSLF